MLRARWSLVMIPFLASCEDTTLTHVSNLWAAGAATCAETTDGRLWCWGSDPSRQNPDGSARARIAPTLVVGGDLRNIDDLAIADTMDCAVQQGVLVCWGTGVGSSSPSLLAPQPVGDPVTHVSISELVRCVIKADTSAWCWGFSPHGGLGDGLSQQSDVPVPVTSMSRGVASLVAGGAGGTFALKDDSTVWGWGEIAGANLLARWSADPSASPWATEPVAIVDTNLAPIGEIRQIRGTAYFTCALDTSDRLLCWGNLPAPAGMERRQIDVATVIDLGAPPVPTTEIAAGRDMTCRLRADGTVDCMGLSDAGQLGDGTTSERFAMAPVVGLPAPATHIANGDQHACATLSDDTLWCWGANGLGQLGVGDSDNRLRPTQVVFR